MHLICYLLLLLLSNTFLGAASEESETVSAYYDTSLQGYKLHGTVLSSKVVPEKIDCLLECLAEQNCGSINYNKGVNLKNQVNCELLNNFPDNKSVKLLEKNRSFDYAFQILPGKSDSSQLNDQDESDKTPGSHANLTSCETTWLIKKGCYSDPHVKTDDNQWIAPNRTLPIFLNVYPKVVNWTAGWDDHVYDVTCYCANLTKNAGHRFFGVQDFKECWTGELSSEFFNENVKASECWGVRPDYKNCIDGAETKCVGTGGHNYIYEIITAPGSHANLTSCETTWLIKKGCYSDPHVKTDDNQWIAPNRTLPIFLNVYPKVVNWTAGWNDHVYGVTCYCTNLTKNAGHRFFGVQDFKECWTGELTSEFFNENVLRSASGCWGVRPDYENCIDGAETKCVGTSGHNYIYEIMTEPLN